MKMLLIVLIITCIVSLPIVTTYANEKPILPKYIEIGLYFGSSAKSVVHLKSSAGFIGGIYKDDIFQNMLTLIDFEEIILRKDSYYIESEGNFVEYTGNIKETGSLNIQGPYHIQVGDPFESAIEAQTFLEALEIPEDLYLAYEAGEWKVFAGFYIDEATAKEKADQVKNTIGINSYVITPSKDRVQVLDGDGNGIFVFNSKDEVYIQAFHDKGEEPLINLEGRNFRGAITAKRMVENDMAIVNRLLLEEYLYGVVPKEMSPSWPLEALKAQAVAARGFAITSMTKFQDKGFNLCNTVNSQVYGGYDIEHPNTSRAVDETKGKIITHNGVPITPFYHSNSGGRTENSENIWSSSLEYIRGKEDEYSLDAPNSSWSVVLNKAEIENILIKNQIDVGKLIDIKIIEASPNGRVLEMLVQGTKGEEILKKQKSRFVFGLRSSCFTIQNGGETDAIAMQASSTPQSVNLQGINVITSTGVKKLNSTTNINIYNGKSYNSKKIDKDIFIFNGQGFGHGLGMSQYGAKRMAEMNYTYEDILSFYYTNIKVE
ncbi:SpoIID/LytB domain-containing protein [Alkaliphilus pronyensis]|nr:SpoIID/LytB domain-containing protein [Alkaliphilus pronyensis]